MPAPFLRAKDPLRHADGRLKIVVLAARSFGRGGHNSALGRPQPCGRTRRPTDAASELLGQPSQGHEHHNEDEKRTEVVQTKDRDRLAQKQPLPSGGGRLRVCHGRQRRRRSCCGGQRQAGVVGVRQGRREAPRDCPLAHDDVSVDVLMGATGFTTFKTCIYSMLGW